jgi:hypothetical protein
MVTYGKDPLRVHISSLTLFHSQVDCVSTEGKDWNNRNGQCGKCSAVKQCRDFERIRRDRDRASNSHFSACMNTFDK